MKTLSIQQPWAWLIVNGFKQIENRSWACNHRGPLLIHASKTVDLEAYEWLADNFPDIHPPERDEIEKGGIVGRVDMVDCITDSDSPWFFGKYGFVFGDWKPLQFAPLSGKLGLFEVSYGG